MIPQRVVTPGWGAILREAREIRSLTQRELGEIVGMDHSRISQLENEVWQPNLDDIHLLCTALGIWPERILEKLGITLLAGRATKLPVGLVESAADLPAWAQQSLEATSSARSPTSSRSQQ